MKGGLILHGALCLAAAVVPWVATGTSSAPASRFPGWPVELDGVTLRPLALTPGEENLARQFPGRMAKFTDGRRQIVLRFIERDTRLYHSSADCMRALGYEIHLRPPIVDSRGHRWGAFEAARDGQRLLVRERIHEAGGERSWSDVSSWYWSASLKRSPGPWWSVMIAAPAGAEDEAQP